jgi:hypothetical protein
MYPGFNKCVTCWTASLFAVVFLPGCPSASWVRGGNDLGPPLPANASTAELVGRLNANTNRLYAWRSTDVQISGKGIPVKLSAQLAVEAPRNFRLRVSSPFGREEADLGSNPERFWFWMSRSDTKQVITARHDDTDQLRLPFQPDWLMEVLGVIPIDETMYSLQHQDSSTRVAVLMAEQLTASGQPVRRVMIVDTRHGLILEHRLYDATTLRLIGKAVLRNHRMHPQAQVVLPHRIELEWPQTGMQMTMDIGRNVEINPPGFPPQTWQIPPGRPVYDLGHELARGGAEERGGRWE